MTPEEEKSNDTGFRIASNGLPTPINDKYGDLVHPDISIDEAMKDKKSREWLRVNDPRQYEVFSNHIANYKKDKNNNPRTYYDVELYDKANESTANTLKSMEQPGYFEVPPVQQQTKVEEDPLQQIAKAVQQPQVVPPITQPTAAIPTVVTQPATQPTIAAGNAPYSPNKDAGFTITEEGKKLGIIQENGAIGHVNQSHRTPEQWNALYDFYSKRYKSNRPPQSEAERRSFVTQAYNEDHKAGVITDNYIKSGFITPANAPTPAAPAPKTASDIVNEAATSGKSFLQMYQESMPKPEYEQERADRIQTNSKASIIADILKLVGEGITTKKGGQPIVRQSAVPMLNAELQKLNDTYKAEAKAYKQGGFNALLMDEQEKKRTQAVEAARKAALQQTLLTQAAQAERESARQKAASEEKEKDRKFQADQKAKDRSTTLTAAQTRAANGGSKSDNSKTKSLYIDGQDVSVPESVINYVSGEAKKKATIATDPILTMSPVEVFAGNWDKYFDYKDGKFVPKGKSKDTATGDPLNLGIKKTKSNPLGLNI